MRAKLRRGISLGEVVIASGIVSLGVVAFSAAFPSSSRAVARSRHRDQAAQAAHQELEYWREVGYPLIHEVVVPGANSVAQAMVTPLPPELANATTQVIFTRAGADFTDFTGTDGTDTGRVRVVVRIQWPETVGGAGSVEMATVVPNNSLEDAVNGDDADSVDADDPTNPDTDDDKTSDDIAPEQNDEDLSLGLPLPPPLPGR